MLTSHTDDMVWIPEGEFHMGAPDFYVEERPVLAVGVDGFWMDPSPVTNRDFARFVEATGYMTVAERDLIAEDYPGLDEADLAAGSLVFIQTRGPVDLDNPGRWWRFVRGANWRNEAAHADHPVVHVAYEDASAYANWRGKSLPTEAEWEYAARGGLDGATYPWGNDFHPGGKSMANTWEGDFPWRNTSRDGHTSTSPVNTYPPNGYGLFDMVGNVWEWTQDWWSASHGESLQPGSARVSLAEEGSARGLTSQEATDMPCCGSVSQGAAGRSIGRTALRTNPRGGPKGDSFDPSQPEIRIPRKVLKGGSHLCAPSYCLRYRPAARIPQMIDTATSHIGFRCVVRGG